MFTVQRTATRQRIAEVRDLLSLIHRSESVGLPKTPDSSEVIILRGLFYVHLYSALEYAVRSGIYRAIQLVNAAGVQMSKLNMNFYSLALDPEFTAITTVGKGKQLKKRFIFFQTQSSRATVEIEDKVMDDYLQNVDTKALQIIFNCFCIDADIVADPAHRGYIDEVKDKRNAVAHGRESAFDVGKSRRYTELLHLFDAVEATTVHYFNTLEQGVCGNMFLGSRFRRRTTC